MARSPALKIRIYLHLVPILGVIPSLWTLYGSSETGSGRYGSSRHRDPVAAASGKGDADGVSEFAAKALENTQVRAASRLSVVMGVGCVSALALLGAGASTQASQLANLRFLMASSFVGSGYFIVSLVLMFRIAKDKSIRLPGVSQLSRRLPDRLPNRLPNR